MRKYLGLAMVFALVVSVVPALAGESFHALSQLPAGEQAALTPLPDAQLATIAGTGGAAVTQVNGAVGNFIVQLQVNGAIGDFIDQLHAAFVHHDIFQMNWTTGAPGQQANVARITQRPQ
jgi:phenylpropionate dioxygenase-like ring-hydroxylating dioxygenase large terminal subunit